MPIMFGSHAFIEKRGNLGPVTSEHRDWYLVQNLAATRRGGQGVAEQAKGEKRDAFSERHGRRGY